MMESDMVSECAEKVVAASKYTEVWIVELSYVTFLSVCIHNRRLQKVMLCQHFSQRVGCL